jgi:hypothetical protein
VNALDHRVKRFRKHVLSFEEPSASYHLIRILKDGPLISEVVLSQSCSTRSRTTAKVGVSVAKAHPWKVVVGP